MTHSDMRTRAAGVLLAVVLAALAGCTALPDSGSVQAGQAPAATGSAAPFDFNPPGPAPGARPAAVVSGFLRALQATPVSTRVAAHFLTPAAADRWRPNRQTLVYGSQQVRPAPRGAVARLDSVFVLDGHGRWTAGAPAAGQDSSRDIPFHLVRDAGEWRIADPPDAMIVPQSHLNARYRQFSLYFFDSTAAVLVPEPVYLPTGVQAATMLVAGLLAGPSTTVKGVERSFLPPGTELGPSVPVRSDGVADVPLSGDLGRLPPDRLDLALAQIAWTLRQVDDVERFRVIVDGRPLELPGGGTVADVDGWSQFSPAITSASTDLFGLHEDRVVQLVGGSEIDAASWRGTQVDSPRSLGVSMSGQHFGLVSQSGQQVFLLERGDSPGGRVPEVYDGTDVLRPLWDHTDRMWLLDRTGDGTRVLVVTRGQVRVLPAPALAGRRVRAAALSRDGTRMVTAVAGQGSESSLLMLRVVRRESGRPVRLGEPLAIRTATPLVRVRGIGWRDPATVAVLTRPSASTSQVVLAACDGSSAAVGPSATVDVLLDDGVGLAASPGGPIALMVATRKGALHALNAQGRWDFDVAPEGLWSPTFAG